MSSIRDKVVLDALKVQFAESNLVNNRTHLMCAERIPFIAHLVSRIPSKFLLQPRQLPLLCAEVEKREEWRGEGEIIKPSLRVRMPRIRAAS